MSLYTSQNVTLSELAFTNTQQLENNPALLSMVDLLAVQLNAALVSVTVVQEISLNFQYETRLASLVSDVEESGLLILIS